MTYKQFLDEWHSDDDFVTCHTSGSTGLPKEIRLSKEVMRNSAMRTIGHFGLDSTSRLHSCISPDFIGGKMMAVRADLCGGILTWENPSNRPVLDVGPLVDLLAIVPSQMISILERRDVWPRLKSIIIGGAAIPIELRQKISDSGLDTWETYGMTETASHIALRRICEPPTPFDALPGIGIDIDQRGCLVIMSTDFGKLVTNDFVKIPAPGEFEILGRYDSAIISGGIKIHPEQYEPRLEAALGCPVMLHGEPDPKWTQRVVLTIDDTDPNDSRVDNDRILAECSTIMPHLAIPKKILHQQLKYTPNGKKLRHKR